MNIASDGSEYRNAIFSCQGEFLSKNRGDDRVYIPDQVEDKLHTGKAVVQIAAVEIAVDHLLDMRQDKSLISNGYMVCGRNFPV
jgi:hypothetical protein